MELISFINTEDNHPDLTLAFAIWQPGMEDIRSIILIRTPKYEFVFDEYEQGVSVSHEDQIEESDMLEEIEFNGNNDTITITTRKQEFELDMSKVEENEIKEAINILNKMNFDDRFKITTV